MKRKRAKRLMSFHHLNAALIFLIAGMTGATGVYIVTSSFAMVWSPGTSIRVTDPNHGDVPVAGVEIRIRSSYGSPSNSWYCESNSRISDGDGWVHFYTCPVSGGTGTQAQYYIYYAAYPAGYYEHGGSPYKVNNGSFTLWSGGRLNYPYNVTYTDVAPPPPPPNPPPPPDPPPPPPDSDGDGIPDSSDACPSQHGGGNANGCPTVTPPNPGPAPRPSPAPPPPAGTPPPPTASPSPTTSTKPRPSTRPNPTPGPLAAISSADTTPPATPQNLQAIQSTGIVTLKWDAVDDATTYSVERSLDEQEWTVLDQSASNNYDDISTEYGLLYHYRVAAVDSAGNVSGYASTEITVDDFEANVNPDESITLTSDDEKIIYEIEAGTFTEPVACRITKGSAKPPKNTVIGPYKLICKDKNGDEVEEYQQPITVKFVLPKEQPAEKVSIARLEGVKATNVTSELDEATNIRSITIATPQMLVAIKEGGNGWIWIVIGLLAAAIVAGFIILKRRQAGNNFDSPLASQYIPQTPAPATTVTPASDAEKIGYQSKVTPHEENPLESARDRLNRLNAEDQNPGLPPSTNPTNHPQIHKYHDRPPGYQPAESPPTPATQAPENPPPAAPPTQTPPKA